MTDFLLLATLLLVSGVIAVPLATKLGLGSVLGYLIAGIAISPVLALLDIDVVSLQHFAEFGVVMMLFLVGLELDPHKLWDMRHKLFGLGGLQVIVTTAIVMAIAMSLGQIWSVALAIGFVFALSSTAIVLQTLNEKRLMNTEGGQSTFSVLLFQDIAVIPMLAFIPLLALPELTAQAGATAQAPHNINLVEGLATWQIASVTIIAVAFVLFAGTYLTRPLFRFIALSGLREMFTAAALMIVIGIALLMSLVGLSPALGTFLAGVVLANSEYRHELEANINPFKGLLLGLFFITVGASINFELLFSNFPTIVALTLGLMFVKAAVLVVLAVIFKLEGFDRWLMAIGLAQAGEFGFVLLSFTVANHVIPADIASQLMLVVALSMLLTPICFIVLEKINNAKLSKLSNLAQQADDITEDNDVIIIGHGRVGGVINRILIAAGYKATVVDYSASQLDMIRNFGFKVFFGDGRSPDLLHAAGIDQAKLLVIAIDDKASITEIARHVCHHHPDVHVVARAVDRFHVYDLWAVGCRDIVRETYDSSLRMGRSVFKGLGYSLDESHVLIDAFEERDRKLMIETAPLYREDIPIKDNQEYLAKVKELNEHWKDKLIGKAVNKNVD